MTHEKLGTPLRYVHYAHVTGNGAFPIDMLRFDRCAPKSEQDAAIIEQSVRFEGESPYTVELVTFSAHAAGAAIWTPDRWRSFNWTLKPGRA